MLPRTGLIAGAQNAGRSFSSLTARRLTNTHAHSVFTREAGLAVGETVTLQTPPLHRY